jgi:sugar/nucleoside kinase (ribokinase family)
LEAVLEKEKGLFQAKPPYFLSLGCITYDKLFFREGRFTKERRENLFRKSVYGKTFEENVMMGGASTYSAILARNFGFSAAIVTSIGEDFNEWYPFKDIHLACQMGRGTTTFQNIYEGEKRIQYVPRISEEINEEIIPKEWFNAKIVYACPVLNELDVHIFRKFEGSMIGVAPQGWMRSINHSEGGKIEKRWWENASEILTTADFVILSEEDVFEEDVFEYARLSNILVLTRGRKGADLYWDRGSYYKHIDAFEREEVDTTGAGDVFGAAFLLRYYETEDVLGSAIFASCAASFVVEKNGIVGIPFKEEVIERLKNEGSDIGGWERGKTLGKTFQKKNLHQEKY